MRTIDDFSLGKLSMLPAIILLSSLMFGSTVKKTYTAIQATVRTHFLIFLFTILVKKDIVRLPGLCEIAVALVEPF